MNLREFTSVLAGVVGLAGVCMANLRADETAPVQIPAHQSAHYDVGAYLFTTLLDADNDTNLNLVTATYANPLAVEVADLEAALRTQLGTEEGVGVLVTSVGKEPEEEKSGLKRHDVILQLGAEKVSSPKQFHELVGKQQEKGVEFHVIRKGKPFTVSLTIPKRPVYQIVDPNWTTRRSAARWLAWTDRESKRPTNNDLIWKIHTAIGEPGKEQSEQHYRIGLTLSEADDPLRSQLRLAAGEGLVVTDVVNDSPASSAGIQKNDVLVKLDGKRLTTVEAINAQIQEIKDRKVTAALFRAGNEILCEVTPRLSREQSYRRAVFLSELNSLIKLRHAEHTSRAVLSLIAEPAADPAPGPTPAEQLTVIKKQIAELQKSLEALEAALQTAAPSKAATPEEKK